MAIKPGARKIINGTPNTSPLSEPIAKDSTNKKSNAEINGENNVCTQTFKNLKTSFLYEV